jgi:transcriptional regulator with XRE-family HTH domain
LGKNEPYISPVTNPDPGETWAAWLREQFDQHPTIKKNADLVRAGGIKSNGRPVIDASSVTQWLRGRRPSYELATATANAFGRSPQEALRASGYIHPGDAWATGDDPSVGAAVQDAEDEEDKLLLYRRPEGLSDQEWERIKQESRGFIEWQIERAAHER